MKYTLYQVQFGDDVILAIRRGRSHPVYAGFHCGPAAGGEPASAVVKIAREVALAVAQLHHDRKPEIHTVRITHFDKAFLRPLDRGCVGKFGSFVFNDPKSKRAVVVAREFVTEGFAVLISKFPDCLDDKDFFARTDHGVHVYP